MQDPVTVQRVALLHPKFIPQITAFIDAIEAATGRIFRMVQGLRTFAEQTAIWNQGRITPGKIVTYSKAGQSYHNYGLAGDIVPFLIGSITELDWAFNFSSIRQIALDHGLQCGMDFPHPDYDHFENKFGLNWSEMLHKYSTKDFIPGTTFINIAA